ncbi:MAG: hypothetical protein N3D15_04505 [Syntrophorhabdaceae bacterium]|nr:hypothetical protein [Syntrophorhabdaceae bacterium]
MKYMKPVLIEVVMNLPIHLGHCSHCRLIFEDTGVERLVNQEALEEYPPELHEDFIRLSSWIKELSRLYQHRIVIRLIDIKSFLGVYKSIAYRLRTYPAFIVNSKDVIKGWDLQRLEEVLDSHIKRLKPHPCETITSPTHP